MISYQALRRVCHFAITKPVYQGRLISACGLQTSTVTHSDRQPNPGAGLCSENKVQFKIQKLGNSFNKTKITASCKAFWEPKSEGKTDKASVVTYKQLKSMLASHNVQLFDVRSPDEYQAGRIPDATNIPLPQLENSLKLSPEQFKLQFKVNAPKKEDDNIIFHCRSGKRSLSALEIAHRLGFIKARHYAGGYIDWEANEK